MTIKKYFDKDLNRDCYQVRITRASVENLGPKVDRKISKIETYEEAKKVEKKLCFEVERKLVAEENRTMLWENLVEDWALAARTGDIFIKQLTKGTIWEYRCVIREFTKEWFNLRVGEIDKSRAWLLMDQVERDVSIARRKRLRTAIDTVYKWGMLSGRLKGIQSIPTEGFQTHRKQEEKLPEILTLQEIRQLLSFAKQTEHEWYPIWALALFTGMRSGELFALQWDAVDFENRMIYVHRNWTNRTEFGPTKGRCWRAVPMGDQLLQFLKELKLKCGNERFVLPRFQAWEDGAQAEILRKFCIGTGLPSVKFHTLRACFATQLIKDSIAPAVVMKICGWKDLKTMQRYIRLAGIEVKGATDGLRILPETEVMGRVVSLFGEP